MQQGQYLVKVKTLKQTRVAKYTFLSTLLLLGKKIRYDKYHHIFLGILTLSVLLRIYRFPTIPAGINVDEASSGYESYSLLTSGLDRWGNKPGPYFAAWGSGQNVLQSYLEIPFIKLFGLNVFSVRLLPMLLSIVSIIIVYLLTRKIYNSRVALLSSFLLGTLPWSIMFSRWGLESNLLPFTILAGIGTLTYCYNAENKTYLIPFSLIFFALSFYAYAVALFTIPLFLCCFLLLNLKTIVSHKISFIISLLLLALLDLPFSLFILVNNVWHKIPPFIAHLPISVLLLPANRLTQVSAGENVLADNLHFLTTGLNDGQIWNVIWWFQPLGLVSIPFAVLGLYFSLRTKHIYGKLFALWLLTSIPLFFIFPLNVNRANTLFIPIIVLSAYGMICIYDAIDRAHVKIAFLLFLVGTISAYNLLFCFDYFNNYNRYSKYDFNVGLPEVLATARSQARSNEPVYVSDRINTNYVYTIFYLQADARDFQTHTRFYVLGGSYFVQNYRNYYFHRNDAKLTSESSYIGILKGDEQISCRRTQMLYIADGWHVERCFTR